MAHGTPDWGLVGPKLTTYGLDDLGEHAVRLGSPHLWDRRGDVIWLTTFADGMEGMLRTGTGIGWDVDLFTEHARQGAYCVRLEPVPVAGSVAAVLKLLPFPVSSQVGAEFSFGIDSDTRYMEVDLWYCNGAHEYQGGLRYDVQNDRLQYEHPPAGWTTFATGCGVWVREQCRNTMKVVLNMVTNCYVRAVFNGQTYNLAGLPLAHIGVSVLEELNVRCSHTVDANVVVSAYVDSIIVTQNEP